MSKSEADLQKEFTAWLRYGTGKDFMLRRGLVGVAFELKVCHGETLAYSKVAEHQVYDLRCAAGLEGKVFSYKISDSALGYKPFDCFAFFGAGAFLVVGFNGGRDVYAIAIQVFAPLYEEWLRKGRPRMRLTIAGARKAGVCLRKGGQWNRDNS